MRFLTSITVPTVASLPASSTAGSIVFFGSTIYVWNGSAWSAMNNLTKTDVGLGNVDNTSDANKPISTATQTALNTKALTGPIGGSGLTSNTATIIGRTTTGSGVLQELTGTGVTALLDVFTSAAKGLAPSSGGGTANFLRADGTWAAPAAAAATVADGDKGDILVSGTGATWTIDPNVVTVAKIQQVATASILGRATAAAGNVEVLTGTQATSLLDVFAAGAKGLVPQSGGQAGNFLRADATWATVLSGIADATVPLTKLVSIAPAFILGRAVAGGNGSPEAISGTTATQIFDPFTSSLKGLAPASGGGTANFLRADATWQAVLPLSGGTMTGRLTTMAATTALPSLSIPILTGTPTSPARGDLWTDTDGLYYMVTRPTMLGGSFTDIGGNTLYTTTSPTTPVEGCRLYGIRRANRRMLGYIDNTGRTERLMPWVGSNNLIEYSANLGATVSYSMKNTSAFTVVTAATSVAPSTGSYMATQRRVAQTIATAGGMVEQYSPHVMCSRLPGNGGGGFHMAFRFGIVALNTDAKLFVGLSSSTSAMTNVNPNTLFNLVGLAKVDSNTTALTMIANGSSGTAQSVALPNTGSLTAIANTFWQVELFCKPADTVFGYRVSRFTTAGVEANDEGTLTGTAGAAAGIPADATFFAPHYWGCSSTAVATTLHFSQFYLEGD